MPFKNKVLTPRGKFYTAILIIICIILAYFLLFHPPRAEAIKTMEVELGDVGGVYDGKIKLYRDTDNVLVLEVDSVVVEIEDNDISIAGKIIYRADGTDVPVADGGTGKSSGTQYSIPYYNTTSSFGEIAIGAAEKVLAVNATTDGYEWIDTEVDPWENVLIVAKSGGDYTTIQAALNASAAGDVILIAPGTYDETVTWSGSSNRHLVGMSRDACIITRNFAQPGAASLGDGTFNWSNSNASIQNLTIRNTGAAPDATIALYLGSGIKYIRNCVFYGAGRDIITCGSGENYFDDCRIYNTAASHVIWIYNGNNTFTDCEIKSDGTVVQFTTLAYVKSGSFYNCRMEVTGTPGSIFDLDEGNNTLTVDNIQVIIAEIGSLFATQAGTINLGRVVGEDNNAATFNRWKNADAAFESLEVGTATGATPGQGKFSGTVDALSFTIGANVLTTSEWAALDGVYSNKLIDHAGVSISAGGILSGGGNITANRTISLAHSGVDHNQTTNYDADRHEDTTAWSQILKPDGDAVHDLGTTTQRWQSVYLSGDLHDGTNALTVYNAKQAYNHFQAFSQTVQPAVGYKSVDASPGITLTLQLMDYSANPHTLTWKNGLLVGHTTP